MKRSQNIDKPVNRLKEKNSQDGIWAQMSAHSKFSIKAFWKRLCSSPWTPEDPNIKTLSEPKKEKGVRVLLVVGVMGWNDMKKKSSAIFHVWG